jgi:glycosyltransferase involved in cell wall biosynthesis
MNLLLLDQFSDPGGAQRCLLDLLPAIRAKGWNALVGLPGDGELFARVRDLGFETARITCGSWADAARFTAGTPVLTSQIGTLVREIRADLVYVNGPRLLPGAALRRPPVPVVFHSHSLVPAGVMRHVAGACLSRLQARVIGSCRFVADQWRRFARPDGVRVIYNGVAGPDRPGPRPRVPRIGCVGRIAPEKGQLAFVAAARRIHGAMEECRFVIHGAALFGEPAADAYESEVRAAAEGLPVEFAGWTNDVYGALADLDVLLVPSAAQEATTRVILEAFAAGVPVIAFASGGIGEVITPGHDGFLANTVEEMAGQALEVVQRPDSGLAERARETWRTRFALERYQCQVIAALQEISS